jgi:hypothetical protein
MASGGGREGVKGHIESSDAWPRPVLGPWHADLNDLSEWCFPRACSRPPTDYRRGSDWTLGGSSVPTAADFQQIDVEESSDANTGSTLRLVGVTKVRTFCSSGMSIGGQRDAC